MADKSPQAFRTIREVAEWLGIEAHVLRFWESKFTQIKPVKRAGGRRYYRPADMRLIGGIKVLLHDQGLTIRGAQKQLADEGAAAISALSPPLEEELEAEAAATVSIGAAEDSAPEAKDGETSQGGFFDIEALAEDSVTPVAAAPKDEPVAALPEAPNARPAPDGAAEAPPNPEQSAAPAPAEAPPADRAPEEPAQADQPEAPPETDPGDEAPPPPTPLSELRALLHEAVPLSDTQCSQLAPMVDRLEALEGRLRTGHAGE